MGISVPTSLVQIIRQTHGPGNFTSVSHCAPDLPWNPTSRTPPGRSADARVEVHAGTWNRKSRCVCTHLQVGEEPVVVLQDGVHAVCHGDGVLPVVVRHPPVVLLHRHNKATQLFKLKAAWRRQCYDRNWE